MNVAARLADAATRHQVLVTEAVRREVGGLPGVTFIPLGPRLLKGLTGEVGLFEAVARTVGERRDKSVWSARAQVGRRRAPRRW